MADMAESEGAETVFVSDLTQSIDPLRDLRASRELAAIARRFKPDIVHTHTAKAGVIGRAVAELVRPRPAIVHTYHGHVLEGYFGRAKTTGFRLLERGLATRSDTLIGVSRETVDDLVRLRVAPADRFRVIALGLDLAGFAAVDEPQRVDARRELGIGPEEIVVTFVGRIVPIKRVDLLLRAFAAAGAELRELRLVVVGDGELRPRLEALARALGVAPQVRFLGYRRDLHRIAAASDLAVVSSENEGTPVALIEAAAASVPAVATNVGGVASVVVDGSTGTLVPVGDVSALAAALVKLAGDTDLRRQMGQRAREHALERFGIDRLVRDMDNLYRDLTRAIV